MNLFGDCFICFITHSCDVFTVTRVVSSGELAYKVVFVYTQHARVRVSVCVCTPASKRYGQVIIPFVWQAGRLMLTQALYIKTLPSNE